MSKTAGQRGALIVVTGPSGVGKGTLIRIIRERIPRLAYSVSATTRPRRDGERDGIEYHFLTPEDFDRRVAAGDFVEHAEYAGYQYGTLRSEVERHLKNGDSVVLEIEVQGARQVRRSIPEATLVFVSPPSDTELAKRLRERGTDTPEQMEKRLRTAVVELEARHEFDAEVINDDLETAALELTGLVRDAIALQD
ncbi:MAG: guanylate kinase [bacterium]|nr:guanylate kinase [bacterium]